MSSAAAVNGIQDPIKLASFDTELSQPSSGFKTNQKASKKPLNSTLNEHRESNKRGADDSKIAPDSDRQIAELKEQAYKAYAERNYNLCLDLVKQLTRFGGSDRSVDLLRGWTEYNLGNIEEAAKRFLLLYVQHPDKDSAEGVYYSHLRLNRLDDLTRIERETTLSDLLKQRSMTQGKQAASAQDNSVAPHAGAAESRQKDREQYDPFRMLALSRMDATLSVRSKTGTEGLSRLLEQRAPVVGYGWHGENNSHYRIQVDQVSLSNGILNVANPIGPVGTDALVAMPAGGIPAAPAPSAGRMTGNEVMISALRDLDTGTFVLELGMTPTNAVLPSTLVGRGSLQHKTSWGEAGMEIYSIPVKETMLSYVGMNDPYGVYPAWGRLTRTGFSGNSSWQFENKFSISASLATESIGGVNTRNNNHVAAQGGIGYSPDLARFKYFSVKLSLSYDHYQSNQNLFSYGNGGYYSPQSAIMFGPSLNFLSQEFNSFSLSGAASAHYSLSNSADALRFPLDPGNPNNAVNIPGTFFASNSRGMNYSLALQGLWRLSDQYQFGGRLSYGRSNAASPRFVEQRTDIFLRIPLQD